MLQVFASGNISAGSFSCGCRNSNVASTGKPSLGMEVDPEANAKTWLRVRGDEAPSEEKLTQKGYFL